MKWAIIASMIFHGIFFGFIISNSTKKQTKYPPVMMVRLASPPPQKGAKKPAVVKTSKKTDSKKTRKAEAPKSKTRVAEVNKRKKPKRKKKKQEPVVNEKQETKELPEPAKQGLPEGVELGSEFGSARIDASGFDSPYYLNVVFDKIRRGWDNPFEGPDTVSSTIYFVIDRTGKISDSAIEVSSGMPSYDQAALRAVLGSKPPPLPNQFGSDDLGIHLEFRYIPYN